MVSLIVPYFLTFLGLMTGSAQDFPAFAVFLTFIGVVWTLVRGLAKHSGFKVILLQEAIHAALWLLVNFRPELLGKAIGLVIGLAVAIPLAVVAYVYFIGPLFSGTLGDGDRAPAGAEPAAAGGAELLPQYIYDGDNNRWTMVYRNDNGECRYRCEADNREVYLHHASVSGKSAQTSEGHFHWY